MLSDCGQATSLVAFRHLDHSAGNLKSLKDCPLFTALSYVRFVLRNAPVWHDKSSCIHNDIPPRPQ